jgi:hypothetical protein
MPQDYLVSGPFLGSNRNPYSYQKVEQIDRDITTAWLTLEEITNQLNLFHDESQDAYLTGLELATRMTIEDYLGLTIFPVTYRVYYGATNTTGTQMTLDLPEVSQDFDCRKGVTINSVGFWNGSVPPVFTKLAKSDYYYDPTGNKIVLQSGMPSEVNTIMTNPIVAEYNTAPSIISQYPVIKQAGLLLLTHLYNNRSNSSNVFLHDIPFGVTALLRPYKPLVL